MNVMLKTSLVNTYTGYFTSDKEPDGIENATHNTLAMQTWSANMSSFVLQMYCGLHSVGLIISCEIPCVYCP
jgi:hypothetical protein